jgi:hypothetical protein
MALPNTGRPVVAAIPLSINESTNSSRGILLSWAARTTASEMGIEMIIASGFSWSVLRRAEAEIEGIPEGRSKVFPQAARR